MNYSGGIYTQDVSNGIDHQVTLVGYTDDATVPGGGYWILENSWGDTDWGESGYARMAYTTNCTTETMYCVATKGLSIIVPPCGGPSPSPTPTPTRRASLVLPTLVDAYQSGTDQDKAQVLSMLKQAEEFQKEYKARHPATAN